MVAKGIGLGFRPELAADMLAAAQDIDFVEVVAESSCAHPLARREAQAIAEIWPVVPHGVKLSLGSAGGIDPGRARRLGDLARDLRAPLVSEHVAMTRAGARDIGHLTAIPYTAEAVSVVARNVATARRHLPDIPLLLENIAWSLRWPEDSMDEGAFYGEIVRATGCDLLLDVANLHANALNSGREPEALLDTYPLDRVAMVHVAGGVMRDGFYEDTHAHAVPPEVLDLLARLLERTGPLPIVLERDAFFPPWPDVLGELSTLRDIHGRSSDRRRFSSNAPQPSPDAGRLSDGLAARQADLANVLTAGDRSLALEPFAEPEVARTRRILQQKRVDDALPLLPRVAQEGDVRSRAEAAILAAPRHGEAGGIADARHLADALADEGPFASAARRDRLELRSRFNDSHRSRFLPFVGKETLPSQGSVWAFKGPGRTARTRFLEWRNR